MYSNGKIVKDIITELTSSGITVKGKPFKNNAIYKMLRNEKYIGMLVYRRLSPIYNRASVISALPNNNSRRLLWKIKQTIRQTKIPRQI